MPSYKQTIVLHVDPAMKQAFMQYAQQDCRPVSNFIVQMMMQYWREHPLPNGPAPSLDGREIRDGRTMRGQP